MEKVEVPSAVIRPTPGFVLKGFYAGKKVFLNICYSDHIRSFYTDASGNVRIPVSLGELVESCDKNGNSYTVVDVTASEKAVRQAISDDSFKSEFMRIIAVGLKLKYNIAVSNFRPITVPYKGNHVRPQRIRLDPEALIQEVKTSRQPSGHSSGARSGVPEFSFVLANNTGATLNVLELAQYKSTAATLRDNLLKAFGTSDPVQADNLLLFSFAEIVIHGVSDACLFRLQLSSERLVVSSKTLSFAGSLNVCCMYLCD